MKKTEQAPKLEFTPKVTQALTTVENGRNANYKQLAVKGASLLNKKLTSFLDKKGVDEKTAEGLKQALLSHGALEKVFDKTASKIGARVETGMHEGTVKLGRKVKAGVVRALMYATKEEKQIEVKNYLFRKIVDMIPAEKIPSKDTLQTKAMVQNQPA